MTQQQFLQQLAAALARLSEAEREDILADYRAYFADALADGRSEAEVAAALGDPARLARELLAERSIRRWEADKSAANLRPVLAALGGLGLVNLLLAAPYFILLSVLGSLWLTAGGMLLAGVLLCASWLGHTLTGWPQLDGWVVNDSGVGPLLIAERQQPDAMPRIDIRSRNGERVAIGRDEQGRVVIDARGGDGHFRLERKADGSIGSLETGDENGTLRLDGLSATTPTTLLVLGLVLTLLGGIGSWIGWRVLRWLWQGTGRWLRWQWQLGQGALGEVR